MRGTNKKIFSYIVQSKNGIKKKEKKENTRSPFGKMGPFLVVMGSVEGLQWAEPAELSPHHKPNKNFKKEKKKGSLMWTRARACFGKIIHLDYLSCLYS